MCICALIVMNSQYYMYRNMISENTVTGIANISFVPLLSIL